MLFWLLVNIANCCLLTFMIFTSMLLMSSLFSEVAIMTLREYRIDLGWSQYQLATEAGIARSAVVNAEEGKSIKARSAKAIADALSRAYGREIRVTDLQGLNVR
jgi:DNA-binding XRE family transcriptional regulator